MLGTGTTFFGESGNDDALLSGSHFFGGPDDDTGTFSGGGPYDGGSGTDTVSVIFCNDDCTNHTVLEVEIGC